MAGSGTVAVKTDRISRIRIHASVFFIRDAKDDAFTAVAPVRIPVFRSGCFDINRQVGIGMERRKIISACFDSLNTFRNKDAS